MDKENNNQGMCFAASLAKLQELNKKNKYCNLCGIMVILKDFENRKYKKINVFGEDKYICKDCYKRLK